MLSAVVEACHTDVSLCETIQDVDVIKSSYLGKKSVLHQQFLSMRQLPEEERKKLGVTLNVVRDALEEIIAASYLRIKEQLIQSLIDSTRVDPTAPARALRLGARHPVSLARERLLAILSQSQFTLCDGPEIEDDFHNFTALNVGPDHPARAEQDTFYVKGTSYLLRTHTSPVQIRTLQSTRPPLRIMAPGRVYRADMDATHTPMFHQLEGMVIDKNIHMGHLKGMITHILKMFFDDENLRVQFRPGYFPFTEPSAEVDIWWNDRWLEVLGCGMVHPNVLKGLDISEEYTGYAFGLGIDRLAMLRYGVGDLRMMFENDHRMHASFKGVDA